MIQKNDTELLIIDSLAEFEREITQLKVHNKIILAYWGLHWANLTEKKLAYEDHNEWSISVRVIAIQIKRKSCWTLVQILSNDEAFSVQVKNASFAYSKNEII